LISDLSMPGRSGFDLIREVRQALPPPASRIPAVAVTALTRPEDRQRALGAGFDAFLTKPVDPHAFVRTAVSVAVSSESA
jgi:CheY-like chemotaxis protein